MVVPVVTVGAGIVPLTLYGWLALGAFILGGGYAIWWGTERAWVKFSMPSSGLTRLRLNNDFLFPPIPQRSFFGHKRVFEFQMTVCLKHLVTVRDR